MPTSLTFEAHLALLEASGGRLLEYGQQAGLTAPVPTCPAWDVRALLAHQSMVHRWAAVNVRGDDTTDVPNQTTIRDTVDDITGYYADGLEALLDALRGSPDDLKASTFLNDAPPPRHFWARRQGHETTMHMVDALAALAGHEPATRDAGIDTPVAVDGLDELLRGFFTRGRSKLFDGDEFAFAVTPTDADGRWIVRVAERMTVDDGDGQTSGADVNVTGTAAALYLALWNRGNDIDVSGRPDLLERWRATMRITWS